MYKNMVSEAMERAMKKLLFRVLIGVILFWLMIFSFCSCFLDRTITPIEKYGGCKYIIIDYSYSSNKDKYPDILIKNQDTMFWIRVHEFDVENYSVGDTIK